MSELPSRCRCTVRVRVLWSGPLNEHSRPVQLVCGWHPRRRCDLQVPIPASAVATVGIDPPTLPAAFDQYVQDTVRAEQNRLEQQILTYLVACVPADELVIVERPLGYEVATSRTVMTRDQLNDLLADPPGSRW